MMKKRIISIVVFLVLLVAGFIYLNKVFSSTHYYVNTSEDFKALAKETNIDVIFYGSSHAYTAYNPLIFNKRDRIISFNLGSDALRVAVTDLVLEESLKYTKPKVVVLEVYSASLVYPKSERGKGYQLRALDFVSNTSLLKMKKVKEIYNANELLGVYSPLVRNHTDWNKKKYFKLSRREVFNEDENFYYAGFLGSRSVITEKYRQEYGGFRTKAISQNSERSFIDEQAKSDIKSFVAIAKRAGAEVLIISSPDPRVRYWNYYFFEEINNFCKSIGVPFLNLNDHYDDMDLEIEDFKDQSHLNTKGSIKASLFLANYLKNNYSLPDRSAEQIWKEEVAGYEKFMSDYPTHHTSFEKKIDAALMDSAVIKSIKISPIQTDYLTVALEFDELPHDITDYQLAIHVYPKATDMTLLAERNKMRKYDMGSYIFNDTTRIINLRVPTKIRNINKIELFLFDRKGYKGVIGDKVIVDNIEYQ